MTTALVVPQDLQTLGREMYELVRLLYPICRSITGDGVRQTLALVGDRIPLQIREVPSGTQVLDWVVPPEWNIRDAYIKNGRGERVVDFKRSNLHVVSYSIPTHRRMTLDELREHLHTLPDRPGWVPYRTTYYTPDWGFSLSHDQLAALEPGEYEVVIDSTLAPGHLTYAESVLRGKSESEVLISTHLCHPSLCNDNLAGIALASALARALAGRALRYTYRFLFIPGTIGSITWLALNEEHLNRIAHGLVLACAGDPGPFTYKKSRRGNAEIDRAASVVLRHLNREFSFVDFSPYGYDERQYCSPGFNLPVGVFSRTPYGQFPQYHTSADNLDLITPQSLADSFAACWGIIAVLEGNGRYGSVNPKGEPQLGRRGLYRRVGGQQISKGDEMALLWVLNLADGDHDLLDVAERSGLPFAAVRRAADRLLEHTLVRGIDV